MSDDDLLLDRLGALGSQGAKLGGGDSLAGAAAAAGARWAARLLPNDTYEFAGEVSGGAAAVSAAVLNALQAEGTVQDASESAGTLRVRGVVGAGILNMNPAVVTVDIRRVAEDRSYMIVRGTAKEGLIKQHAGRNAAVRVLRRFAEACTAA